MDSHDNRTTVYVAHARSGPPFVVAVAAVVLFTDGTMAVYHLVLKGLVDLGALSVPPADDVAANLAALLFGMRAAPSGPSITIVGVIDEVERVLRRKPPRRSFRCMSCFIREELNRRDAQLHPVSAEHVFLHRMALRRAREELAREVAAGGCRS